MFGKRKDSQRADHTGLEPNTAGMVEGGLGYLAGYDLSYDLVIFRMAIFSAS